MGLDNLPTAYPCKTQGTALYQTIPDVDPADGEAIDCTATIRAGRCPWANEFAGTPGIVVSMMGAPCWYRGKAAMALLAVLDEDPPFGGFYGPDNDGLDVEQCNGLAAYMEDRAESFSHKLAVLLRDDEQLTDQQRTDIHRDNIERYRYAARWLRWVAEHAGGCGAWW